MKVPLLGFAPDLDPETPGVLIECDAIVPTLQGLAAANSPANVGLPALAATPTSAYGTELLDGTRRLFVGTATKIFEAAASSWTDRSRAGNYTGAERKRFTTFGNIVLEGNKSEIIGAASPGGAFADIAGAPAAKILVSASGFVMALDTNDGVFGDRPDGWWCSGLRDHTTWTPSAATQAANGRLIDSPGSIRAGAALGNDVVAYKPTSLYLGRYVGPPVIWSWQRIPGDIGCSGAESLVVVDSRHYFVGPNDFFVFDGTVPTPLEAPLREWFFGDLNLPFRDKIYGAVDVPRGLIYWHYPSIRSSTGALDSLVVYNYRTNQWGKQALAIDVPLTYFSAQITYDSLGTLYATYDSLPAVSYDSTFWLTSQTLPAVFQSSVLFSLTGTPGTWSLTTGDYGDMVLWTYADRISPRWRRTPTTATLTNFYRETLGDSRTTDATATMSRKRFDLRRSARWHSAKMDGSGSMTLDGLDVNIKRSTKE